ncbi:diguanylate cyclase [Gallintestinimicrobium sp.]|uniref:diguanylate cyclase n=1 Tax=Gallintestinimicrobium sp. TaxID=2981655 RepID=UPI003994B840
MNQEVSITKEQVQKEMKYFRRLFPIVRLLDGERLLRRNDGMEAEPVEIDAPEICHCYDLWKYSAPCKHCIALEAVRSRKEKCKLEIVGNDIYQVIARYLEMNGKPYVMELVHRLDEDALTDLEEKQYLIEQLTGYNEKLYQDVLTGVFNRRYYEEKVKNMWGPVGIAMMDLDNFKYYNDSYGHNVGDLALNSAAKVILSNIRKSDFLIRYGGDEFLLVLPGIRKDAFDKKLNQIQEQLHQTTLDGYPGISLSVSIGGVTTVEETVGTALERADRLMYQAKKHRNQVVTESSTEGIRQKVGERMERDSGRELVLIVDDAKINREILFEMLKDRFDIIEASSGEECLELLHQYGTEISIVLLDFIMSGMDGLGVLKVMNKEHLIEDIPVIMISSEDSELHIRQAYEMGVSDYISRPFDTSVVRQRVYNTIKLYAKQRKLIDLVAGQMQEKEKNNQIMVNILSHIVECRNGESGQHVRNIGILTKILLKKLMQKTDRYQMTWGDLNRIALASALHDIGKIGIEEAILNKPEKLTQEEYEKMKKHTVIGWSMLQNLKQYQEEPLVRIAEQICRWHHERYDGKGYPDDLKGDEIPISAQVVSLADVYDALTNERVYKKAIPHEKAIEMIVTGECGQFNPLLIECLLEIKEDIPIQLMNAEHRNSWTPLGGGNTLVAGLKTEG